MRRQCGLVACYTENLNRYNFGWLLVLASLLILWLWVKNQNLMIISFLTQTVSDPEVPFPSNLGERLRPVTVFPNSLLVCGHTCRRGIIISLQFIMSWFCLVLEPPFLPPYHLTLSLPPSHPSFLWMSTHRSAEPGPACSGLARHFIIYVILKLCLCFGHIFVFNS